MVGDYDELALVMERYGIARAFMFCMDEPDRHPAFRAPNDRTLEHAARSEGRLIPFVRLDLGERPIEEAERCLDLGAKGIKLHPRAQKFLLNDERLAPVFAIAAERKVPILIHGGRGLPPIADDLARLVDTYPDAQLIIAHAGIADLGALMRHFAGKPGVFFDTSAWSPIDLLDFFRQVSPEQVLYASDYPYGQQPSSVLIALRTARVAGLDDAQVRGMLSGNATRIAEGQPPLETTPARGSDIFSQPMVLARIHQYLSMASPLLWTRQAGHGRRARPGPERVRGERPSRLGSRPHSRAAALRPRSLAGRAGDRGRTRPDAGDPRHLPVDPPRRHPRGHAGRGLERKRPGAADSPRSDSSVRALASERSDRAAWPAS